MHNKLINNKEYYIVVFNSKNYAIQLFYKLEKKGYSKFQLVSTPCQLKGGCSYSIKFNNISDINYLEKESSDFIGSINNIYHVERKEGKKHYKVVKYPF
jgi:putative Se/S carrier protein